MHPILVIGIGNEYRCDDGAGLVAIRTLKAKGLPEMRCIEWNGDSTGLLETWTDASWVILIDAVLSGTAPGTIHRFDSSTSVFPADFAFLSSHTFGVGEAIHLGQTLGRFPKCLMIYGIEGKKFTSGTTLSPEVERATQEVVALVVCAVCHEPLSSVQKYA